MHWHLFSVAGVSVRADWTLLLGPVLLTGFRFEPLEWLATLGLVGLHALGHLVAVRAVGAWPVAVELTGYGGACTWHGHRFPLKIAFVAWGGLLVQALLLASAELWGATWPPLLLRVATVENAWLLAVNLLPLRPLDGAKAWRWPWLLGRALRSSLSEHRGVAYEASAGLEFDPSDPNQAQAKQLADELLERARRGGDAP